MQTPDLPPFLLMAPRGPSAEVVRVRTLYLATLRRRVRDGSYFTPARIRSAMDRLFQSLADDSRPW